MDRSTNDLRMGIIAHPAVADRSNDVSGALTEMRTVLSRARTARAMIPLEVEGRRYGWVDGQHVIVDPGAPDPDVEEMIMVLDQFIAAAEKWQRKGKK